MTKPDPDDVKRQIQKQDDDVYGDETVSGSSPRPGSDADTEKNLEDYVGSDVNEGVDEPINTAKEVHDDERARRGGKKV